MQKEAEIHIKILYSCTHKSTRASKHNSNEKDVREKENTN
jgi:hypothetical protein